MATTETAPVAPSKQLPRPVLPRPGAVLSSNFSLGCLSVIAVLIGWQIVGPAHATSISYPSAIFERAVNDTFGLVLPQFVSTLSTFALGFTICVVVGISVGLLMARSPLLWVVLNPYITMLYSMPYITLFPVFILLFGLGKELAIAVVLVGGMIPIIVNAALGASQIPDSLNDVGATFVASRWQHFRTITLPASADYIMAGIRIGFSRALIAAVIIELITSSGGVGGLLNVSARALQIDLYFVPLLYLGLFAIGATATIEWLHRLVTRPWTRPKLVNRAIECIGQWCGSMYSVVARRRRARLTATSTQRAALGSRSGAAGVLARTHAALSSAKGHIFLVVATFVAFLVCWYAYAQYVGTSVLATPGQTVEAAWRQLVTERSLYDPLLSSCVILVVSFILSLALGIPLGILIGRSRVAAGLLNPHFTFLYVVPNGALLPIMVVLLGFGVELRIVYAVLSGIFIVIINTTAGVRSIDPELIATGRSFCASERQILRTIILPGAAGFIVAGARIAFAATWIGVVVAEILSTQTGLGGLITYYSNFYLIPDMFVPILAIMLVSLAILGLTTWVQPRLTPWLRSSPAAQR